MKKDKIVKFRVSDEDLDLLRYCMDSMYAIRKIKDKKKTHAIIEALRYYKENN